MRRDCVLFLYFLAGGVFWGLGCCRGWLLPLLANRWGGKMNVNSTLQLCYGSCWQKTQGQKREWGLTRALVPGWNQLESLLPFFCVCLWECVCVLRCLSEHFINCSKFQIYIPMRHSFCWFPCYGSGGRLRGWMFFLEFWFGFIFSFYLISYHNLYS